METKGSDVKPRRARGTGGLWLVGRVWWMQYYSRGQKFRESTGETDELKALRALRRRLRLIAEDVYRPEAKQLRYEDLRETYMADYAMNRKKSLRYGRKDGLPYLSTVKRLDRFFAGFRAREIDAPAWRRFIAQAQAEGLSNGTINHSRTAMRRMFSLAVKDEKLRAAPHLPKLKDTAPRQGFFERETYDALRAALPDYLQVPLAMGYHTGMRRAEILGLRWEQIDFLKGVIRLNAGETKNNEGREIPIIGELASVLRAQHAKRRTDCDLVCFRIDRNGRAIPVGDMRKVWYNRCVKLGFGEFIHATDKEGTPVFDRPRGPRSKPKPTLVYKGIIFHDLRRTGVRNLVRAGVPEKVAMEITGHKTRSVFDRYNITNAQDIQDAGEKLERYNAEKNGASLVQIGTSEEPSKQLPN
jgi:integrase